MNRGSDMGWYDAWPIPRASGDEPEGEKASFDIDNYSPRQRG
ncbi:hypothetical protein YERSI8AC_40152 [Enterobacterales bacterium 8AC]|nr:hypothetical protein YERSI8AC_40152 [Enterobacterales bacterium 8AC]